MNNFTSSTIKFKFSLANINWRIFFLLPVVFCSCLIGLTASNHTALAEAAFSCEGEETGIMLVSNDGKKKISIRNGQELCSSQINFSSGFIRVTTKGKVGSMRIWVTGAVNHDVLENFSPYDSKRFNVRNGDYKVRTKIFSKSRGGGSGCDEANFRFSIKNCAAPTPACKADGGKLKGGPFSFCVGNGTADNIPAGAIKLTGGKGAQRGWVVTDEKGKILGLPACLLYTSPSPRDKRQSRMPSSA